MGLYKVESAPKTSIKKKILELLKPFKAKKRDKLPLIRPGVKKLTEPEDKHDIEFPEEDYTTHDINLSTSQTISGLWHDTGGATWSPPEIRHISHRPPYVSGRGMSWDIDHQEAMKRRAAAVKYFENQKEHQGITPENTEMLGVLYGQEEKE